MEKKLILLLLSTTLLLSACGSSATTETAPSSEVIPETTASEDTTESSDDFSDIDTIGDIEVDEGLFDVELTIPADFVEATTQEELDLSESFSVMAFYMYGGMYNIFAGTPVDNIHVEFINADSGEVISAADSSNMGE